MNSRVRYYCFIWRGLNNENVEVRGKDYALNKQELYTILRHRKIQVLDIRIGLSATLFPRHQQMTRADITLFTRQLATMVDASLPLSQALELYAFSQEKAECRTVALKIKFKLETGELLSQALRQASYLFDDVYIALIASAEHSGQLAFTLKQMANEQEKNLLQQAKFKKALLYPTTVVLVSLTIAYLLLAFVIPEFQAMFDSFDAELPAFTQRLLDFSRWLSLYFFHQLIAFSLLLTLVRLCYQHNRVFRYVADKKALTLPLIGPLLSYSVLIRYSRTVALGIRSGIPVVNCLKLTILLTHNQYCQQVFRDLFKQASSGIALYAVMQKKNIFPQLDGTNGDDW